MLRIPILLLVFALTSPMLCAQDEDSATVKKAKSLVKDNASTILSFAHPTCKFKDVGFNEFSALQNGFKLTYTLVFDGKVSSGLNTKVEFIFDKNGKLDYINPVKTTALYKPFTTDVSAKSLDEMKKRMKDVEKIKDNRDLLKKVDEAKDSKILCEMFMQFLP